MVPDVDLKEIQFLTFAIKKKEKTLSIKAGDWFVLIFISGTVIFLAFKTKVWVRVNMNGEKWQLLT